MMTMDPLHTPATADEMTTTTNTTAEATEKHLRTKVGVVDRDKTDKTRRVVIQYSTRHPKYGKYIRRRTVLWVHDENNETQAGDRVEITPCRPMSRTKRWRLVRVIEKSTAI